MGEGCLCVIKVMEGSERDERRERGIFEDRVGHGLLWFSTMLCCVVWIRCDVCECERESERETTQAGSWQINKA